MIQSRYNEQATWYNNWRVNSIILKVNSREPRLEEHTPTVGHEQQTLGTFLTHKVETNHDWNDTPLLAYQHLSTIYSEVRMKSGHPVAHAQVPSASLLCRLLCRVASFSSPGQGGAQVLATVRPIKPHHSLQAVACWG